VCLCLYPLVPDIPHGFRRYQNASAAEIQTAFYLPDQLEPLTRITDSEVCKTNERTNPTRTSHHASSYIPATFTKTHALPFILLLQKPQHVPRQCSLIPPPHQRNSALLDATPAPQNPNASAAGSMTDSATPFVQLRAHMVPHRAGHLSGFRWKRYLAQTMLE
jgi:hypothetical protein